jgi:hypothetical protein
VVREVPGVEHERSLVDTQRPQRFIEESDPAIHLATLFVDSGVERGRVEGVGERESQAITTLEIV